MRSWITEEVLDTHIVNVLNVVIPTKGCSWNKCYMCSYSLHSETEEFIEEFKKGFQDKDFEKVKIFTSGSFLDRKEVNVPVRNRILDLVKEKNVKELTIETRPEFVKDAAEIKEYLGDITLEVALGLESCRDRILHYCINKGFTFSDFEKAVVILNKNNVKVKAYILIKPPFLSEYEGVEDAVYTAESIADMVDVISFNPVVIHKKTVVEYLWRNNNYTPPWMWSVVEVLNRTWNLSPHIICHPVAVGKYRGIRNCKKCTYKIAQKIREYSLTNEKIEYDCECKKEWIKEMALM
ncbi:MAG: archaeosine biosynthesis radical SAM protein RaSEA [Candidatus Methanofastidiosia archaeon]